jgi:hypothetical protein
MLRFTIRDVLWLTVVTCLSPAVADEEATAPTSWVVSDAYAVGKPRRESVGTGIVFGPGRIHFINDKGVTTFAIRPYFSPHGRALELIREDKVLGKMLLIEGDDALSLYINHNLRGKEEVIAPEPAKEKCIQMYECRALSDEEGLSRLKKHGVKP